MGQFWSRKWLSLCSVKLYKNKSVSLIFELTKLKLVAIWENQTTYISIKFHAHTTLTLALSTCKLWSHFQLHYWYIFQKFHLLKHLMTGPAGNSEIFFPRDPQCFPRRSRGKHWGSQGNIDSLLPIRPIIKCFVIPPNSKLEKTEKKLLTLHRLAHKFAAVSRRTTWSHASRLFMFTLIWPIYIPLFID